MFVGSSLRLVHARVRAVASAGLGGHVGSGHRRGTSRRVGWRAVRRGFSRFHVDVWRGVGGELRPQPGASDFHQTVKGSNGSFAQSESILPKPLAGR